MSGRFSDHILDDIKARVRVSEVLSRHVQWDKRKSVPAKGDHWACCPFHSEKTPSFHADDRRGRYHCFGCKETGDVFSVLTKLEGLSFPEAVETLAELAGVALPKVGPKEERRAAKRERLVTVQEAAAVFFEKQLRRPTAAHARQYLMERGILGATAKEFRIGYAPNDETSLRAYLREGGFGDQDLLDAGLIATGKQGDYKHVRFKDRIVFPIQNRRGKVVGFGGRALNPNAKAKYLNSSESLAFTKGYELYNQHRARVRANAHETGELLIVEGYMDVIRLWQAGYTHVVAPLGTALTHEQLSVAWRMAREPMLVFDGDKAGQLAARRTAEIALERSRPNMSVNLVTLPAGVDPDDLMASTKGRKQFDESLASAVPLFQAVWDFLVEENDCSTPERRAGFVQTLCQRIAEINDPGVRNRYLAEYQGLLNSEFGIKDKLKLPIKPRHRLSAPPSPDEGGEEKNAQSSQMGNSASLPDQGDGARVKSGEEIDASLALFDTTDLGNADRFVKRAGEIFRFCLEIKGNWLAWDGQRWNINQGRRRVKRACHQVVRLIHDEAAALQGTPDDVEIKKNKSEKVMLSEHVRAWGLTSQGSQRINCIPGLAEPYITVDMDDLDQHPLKIVCLNCTLEIGRGDEGMATINTRPHEPEDLITKIMPVIYDPGADCPTYDRHMLRVQPTDETRAYLHRWGGLNLTGIRTEQKMNFWHGGGRNGKSVTINAWCHVAGEYADQLPIESLIDDGHSKQGGQATPDLAKLKAVRMLRASEPEKGKRLKEGLIKLVTGGEPMDVRFLGKEFFTLHPEFKLTISGNHKPEIRGADVGIWSRVHLVPWGVQIPDAEQDEALDEKLRAEASGILNRLLEGLLDYLDFGLEAPDEVLAATAQYREQSDQLGRFLALCVEDVPGERVQSTIMYELFDAWCQANSESRWKQKGFSQAMKDRGYSIKSSNTSWFQDVKVVKSIGDFLDHEGNPIVREGDDESDQGPNDEPW